MQSLSMAYTKNVKLANITSKIDGITILKKIIEKYKSKLENICNDKIEYLERNNYLDYYYVDEIEKIICKKFNYDSSDIIISGYDLHYDNFDKFKAELTYNNIDFNEYHYDKHLYNAFTIVQSKLLQKGYYLLDLSDYDIYGEFVCQIYIYKKIPPKKILNKQHYYHKLKLQKYKKYIYKMNKKLKIY